MSILDILLLLAAVSGAMLLLFGLRGRLIDDHPLCARCGFDLTGKPTGSDRCAECGNELSKPGAIRIGHRQRPSGALWAAAGILTPVVVLTALSVARWFGHFDFEPWKPAQLLMWEADHGEEPDRIAALAELMRRLNAGSLSQGSIVSITADAMRRQIDPALPWSDVWGDFVAMAFAKGKIPQEAWTTFARHAMNFNLAVRPMINPGDPLPAILRISHGRTGQGKSFQARITWRQFSVAGAAASEPPKYNVSSNSADEFARRVGFPFDFSSNGSGQSYAIPDTDWITRSMLPGEHPVTAKLHVQILDPAGGSVSGDFEVALQASVEVASPNVEIEFFKTDESQRKAVESSIKSAIVSRLGTPGIIRFTVDHSPVALAMRPFLRLPDGREFQLEGSSYIDCVANEGRLCSFPVRGADLRGVATVDLILRPDIDLMKRSIEMSPRWGEPIIISNIQVERSQLISTRPSATMPQR